MHVFAGLGHRPTFGFPGLIIAFLRLSDLRRCLVSLVLLFLAFQDQRITRPCLADLGFADLGLILGLSLENFGQFSATLLLFFIFLAFVLLYHL